MLPISFSDLMCALNECFFNEPDDVIGSIEEEETEEEGELELIIEEALEGYDIC